MLRTCLTKDNFSCFQKTIVMLEGITPEILTCLLTVNLIKLFVSNKFKIYLFYFFRTVYIKDALYVFPFLWIITKEFVYLNKRDITISSSSSDCKFGLVGWSSRQNTTSCVFYEFLP